MPRLIALWLCALLAGGALAEDGSQNFGDYAVNYAAMPTEELTPEIAASYGITRGRGRALVLINLQKQGAMAAAKVTGRARNLVTPEQTLVFREVRQQNAVDYLAELPVLNGALVIFEVEIQAADASAPMQLQFRRKFIN